MSYHAHHSNILRRRTLKYTPLPRSDSDFRKRPIGNSGPFFGYALSFVRIVSRNERPHASFNASVPSGATALQNGVTSDSSEPFKSSKYAASDTTRKAIPVVTGQVYCAPYFHARAFRIAGGSTVSPDGIWRMNLSISFGVTTSIVAPAGISENDLSSVLICSGLSQSRRVIQSDGICFTTPWPNDRHHRGRGVNSTQVRAMDRVLHVNVIVLPLLSHACRCESSIRMQSTHRDSPHMTLLAPVQAHASFRNLPR